MKGALSRLRAAVGFHAGSDLVPPRRRNFNVHGSSAGAYHRNLESNRRDNLRILQTAYELYTRGERPAEQSISLLDFGCSFSPIGQAYALDAALVPRMRTYLGVDIDRAAITWCERITRLRPDFEYRVYEAAHERYFEIEAAETADAVRPADFSGLRTSLETRRFDIQLSSSVFTHLYLTEFAEFLDLVTAHLTPGGLLFNSAFLVDPASDALWTERSRFCAADRKFIECAGGATTVGCYTYAPHNPRAGIAYARNSVMAVAARAKGLALEGFLYGHWRGVQRIPLSPNYQDWIVLRRL